MPQQPGFTAQQKDPRQLGNDLVQTLAEMLAHNTRFLDGLHQARPLFFRGTVTALQTTGGMRQVQVQRAGQAAADAYWYPIYDAGYTAAVGDDVLLVYTDRRMTALVIGGRTRGVDLSGLLGGTGSTTTVVSDTTARVLDLWTGSANAAQPSGWHDPSFDDSAWTAAVAVTVAGYDAAGGPLAGSAAINLSNTLNWPDGADFLFRQTFTLPAGVLSAATLTFRANDLQEGAWLNGVSLGQGLTASGPTDIGPDLVVSVPLSAVYAGASNTLATWVRNASYSVGVASPAWASYTLAVTYSGLSGALATSLRWEPITDAVGDCLVTMTTDPIMALAAPP